MIKLIPRMAVAKALALPLILVITGVGMFMAPSGALGVQFRDNENSSGTHQVPVPGLGQNPWQVESFFKDLGISDGRDGVVRSQLEALKNLLENQKVPLDPNQKQLLENLLKNPGAYGGTDGLRDLAKGMISKADPEQQKIIRDKLSSLRRNEGASDLFSEMDKMRSGMNRPVDNGAGRGGGLSKMPSPIEPNGNAFSKSGPTPSLPDRPNNTGLAPPQTNTSSNTSSPRVDPGQDPRANPNVGDLSKMLSRIMPFGLDQKLSPIGKDFLQKLAGWSSKIKLPESWKPGIQKAIKELNLPGALGNGNIPISTGPNIGGSFSGSNMLLTFMIGFGIFGFVVWVLSKWNWSEKRNFHGIRQLKSPGNPADFVAAMEESVIRLGGSGQAFGNHLKWRRECGSLLVARGMEEEQVGYLFDVYESSKYLGLQPGEAEESRLLEVLKQHG